ncbi:MAG: anthranilate phosphoribosyltransferase [Eubacteriales bacterium]|nr:anthranilate phosphoribosyltransferase [Eubacteriales bacterium]
MIKKAIAKLSEGIDLDVSEASAAMEDIMEGGATPAQIGSFVTALKIKGETAAEITGCAGAMRSRASSVKTSAAYMIDTCGTGGDGKNTFNISTIAAIIAASCGIKVAKHGNRCMSSRCGSADVLEALGINISLEADEVGGCIDSAGIGFLFAQTFHKSMRHAAGPRRELGIRTVFNILGPLCNPAGVKGQVLGISEKGRIVQIAEALRSLGLEKALVVHGIDGMDEISVTDETMAAELKNGEIICYSLKPEEYGFKRAQTDELSGGGPGDNAAIIKGILNGGITGAKRDAAVLNAGAAIYIGKEAKDIREGIYMAEEAIRSGRSAAKLEELRIASGPAALKISKTYGHGF